MNTNQAFLAPTSYEPCIGKYELNLMVGCKKCIYCSISSDGPVKKLGIDNLLNSEIPQDVKDKGIYLSPNSDAFSPIVRDNAHIVLERFLPQGVPFLIITKNVIPQNTVDLLAKYSGQICAQISIARLSKVLNELFEPGVASAADRLDNIRRLSKAGVNVTPVMMPLLPGIDDSWERLESMVAACAAAGAKYLKAAYVVIKPEDEPRVRAMKAHPRLAQSWKMMTEKIRINIGGGMIAPANWRSIHYFWLNELCEKYGVRFQVCPILDPAVLHFGVARICRTYVRRNPECQI